MSKQEVKCSRCDEAFETQDDLILHSVEVHTGDGLSVGPSRTQSAPQVQQNDGLSPELVDELLRALEERTTSPDRLLVRYGQRFLAGAGLAIFAIVIVLTYLQLQGVIDAAVYLFSLGTLFGIALSYLQAFVQALRRESA